MPSGGATINTLAMTTNVGFANGSNVLNLTAGGLIGASGLTFGANPAEGFITAGGIITGAGTTQDLYIYNRSGVFTINSSVVDNSTNNPDPLNHPTGFAPTPVRLVISVNGGIISLAGVFNSYSGGTVVNGGANGSGTVNLAMNPGFSGYLIPAAGGLTINDATVTETTESNEIDPNTVVSLNGSSILNLLGNDTLGGLVFRNDGGSPTNATQNGLLGSTGYMEGSLVNSGGLLTINGKHHRHFLETLGLFPRWAAGSTLDPA